MSLRNNHSLPPACYVDDETGLHKMMARLQGANLLAIDTESNSLYAYQERVCLIQISTRQADYIVDPLRIDNLSLLGDIFADWRVELIFHAAEYDIMTMKRDFHFTFNHLFDTMTAARILGIPKVGFSSLLKEELGVFINKSHQKDNWARRPLSPQNLLYAQQDTHFLVPLRNTLARRLQEEGHWDEAQEIFAEQILRPAAIHRFDPEGYWPIARSAKLTPPQRSILRECYLLREELARERDRPPFKIIGKDTLVALARNAPQRMAALRNIKGLSADLLHQSGERFLNAIAVGQKTPPKQRDPHPRLEEYLRERIVQLSAWRKQRAARRGVDADIIISKASLRSIAEQRPRNRTQLADIVGLGPWRIEEYGAELLEIASSWPIGAKGDEHV